jgi:hypothetical protein
MDILVPNSVEADFEDLEGSEGDCVDKELIDVFVEVKTDLFSRS